MRKRLLFTCLVALTFSSLSGQLVQVVQFYLLNPQPCQNDTVRVVAQSSFNTAGCWQVSAQVTAVGNHFQIDAGYCKGMLQSFSSCQDTFTLGVLSQGAYTATFNLAFASSSNNCQPLLWADSMGLSFNVGNGAANSGFALLGDTANLAGDTTGFCTGNSIVLAASQAGGSYQWLENGSPIPGATGQSLVVSDAGLYALIATGCGLTDTSAEVVVVEGPPPVYQAQGLQVCDDDTPYSMSGGTPAGGSWNGPYIQNGNFDPVAAPAGFHSFWYVYEDTWGCRDSAAGAVDVVALPPTPTITLVGDSLMSSSPTGNLWFDQNGPIFGANGQYFVPTQSGTYYVMVGTVGGCMSDTSAAYVYKVTGREESWASGLRIRRGTEDWEVEVELAETGPARLDLFDLRGHRLYLQSWQHAGSAKRFRVPHVGLSDGIYALRLTIRKKSLTQKILLQK